jgi:O-Antigen ligase
VVLLAPALTSPMIAIGLVALVVTVWLAWKSVAYPLALAGIPTLIAAIVGTNPLPKGGATFLVGAWVALAVLLAMMRGEHTLAAGALWSAPVAMAVLLLGLMVLRLSGSPDQAYGSMKVQLYIANNLLFMVGAVFVASSRPSLRLFFGLTLAVVAAGSFLLLGKLLGGGAQQQFSGRFAISAQQGSINLGRDSSNGALIAICLILMADRTWVRLASIAVLPALLVALLAAGSRGPVLAFIAGLVALVALTAVSGRARRQLTLVAAVLLAAAVVVPLVVPGSSIGRSLSTIVGSASGLSSNGRSGLWALAFSTFGNHPWAGIGTGGFAALNPETFPHNLLLEMAVELGIVGALAVGSMLVMMARRMMLAWQRTSGAERMEVTLVTALFVSAFVNALFSGAIQDNTDVWLWGGLGLGIYARHRRPTRSRARAAWQPIAPP